MHGMQRLIFLQFAKKVCAHAHQRPQSRISDAFGNEFRKAALLALLRTNVKFLALVNVEQECRRL
jgi:hypothetical protein